MNAAREGPAPGLWRGDGAAGRVQVANELSRRTLCFFEVEELQRAASSASHDFLVTTGR